MKPLRIWHVGGSSDPTRVDGVSRVVWMLSREQARLGHHVSFIVDTPPTAEALRQASDAGVKFVHVQASYLGYPHEIRRMLDAGPIPDIVHMHSVFIVRHATLGRVLAERGIPYIITPHGGLAPQVLRRGLLKKSIYSWLRERPRFMAAAAIGIVTPGEERAVRAFVPDYRGVIRWLPNPVDVQSLQSHQWKGPGAASDGKRHIVFLGRFDVLTKGIDILLDIARLLPEAQFDLYGTEDPKTLGWLNQLRSNLPGNVTFHRPIHGQDKARVLSQASLYLQPSRWEGFPVSVAECMYLGVPTALSEPLDAAQLVYQHHLGLVLPLEPVRAAAMIRALLDDEPQLRNWSQRARAFAAEHFHPTAAANNNLRLYQDVLEAHRRRQRGARPAASAGVLPTDALPAAGRRPAARRPRLRLMPAHFRGSVKNNVSVLLERSSRLLGNDCSPRTIVLCYHSVACNDSDLSVDPQVLRWQIEYLQRLGFQFTTLAQLAQRLLCAGPPTVNTACITFDDGYEDNLTVAAPLLAELKVPATVFVTTGLMIRDGLTLERFGELTRYQTTYLSASQVAELHRLGFEIGAHTHTHANLARLSEEQTRYELFTSKRLLEDAIGAPLRSFAYPFGKRHIHYTPMTIDVVRDAGFVCAAAVAFRAINARRAIRIFELPRFFVNRSDSFVSFRHKVAGHYDWLGSIQEATPAWLKSIVSPEDRYG
ncbi:polysaccharide deacetylase family protein [Fontivita pretiosa]|uniref:polysaccharide deacetylase family protein n=1 Tax=Fontivita pretiosa TaxID=2989684 RepID=UPI003D18340F